MTGSAFASIAGGQGPACLGITGALTAIVVGPAVAQEIYLADHYERPGFIYQYDPVAAREEPVYTHPNGNLSAIAFDDDYVYYVNANAEHIYRSDGCRSEIVYTHATYVRDIAFDSAGRLYFSESSGARDDGTIYRLDITTGERSQFVSVELDDVDGFWAGNFAFDPADNIYVSSGNHLPASIYARNGPDYERKFTSPDPIMGFTFTGPDTLLFTDHAQGVQELTGFTTVTPSITAPARHWLQDVALGPVFDWPQQQDRDGDGEGDVCDCDDNFMSSAETGADCGGICGGTCPDCTPVLISGDPARNIDIVFVPDADYGSATAAFRDAVRDLIVNGYFSAPEISDAGCLFNFYYFDGVGDYEPVCAKFDLPADLANHCAFADSKAIVFTGGGRACSSGSVFSTQPGGVHVVLHESGHNLFDLSDEYCCDGSYWQAASGQPNAYETLATCVAGSNTPANCLNFCPERVCTDTHAHLILWGTTLADCQTWATGNGLNSAECVQEPGRVCAPNWRRYRGSMTCSWGSLAGCQAFATGASIPPADCFENPASPGQYCYPTYQAVCLGGGDGWFKGDTDVMCTMHGGLAYEPDCSERVTDTLAAIGTCAAPGGAPSLVSVAAEGGTGPKAVILELTIGADTATVDARRIVPGPAPSIPLATGRFALAVLGADGAPIDQTTLRDPRVMHVFAEGEAPAQKMLRESATITVAVPFDRAMHSVEITDRDTGKVLARSDLSALVDAFCHQNPDDPDCGGN